MIFEANCKIRTPSRHIARTWSDSSGASTFAVDSLKKILQTKDAEGRDKERRTVRFDESLNQVFPSDTEVFDDPIRAKWYSSRDIQAFRQEHKRSVIQLRQTGVRMPNSLPRKLQRLYSLFSTASCDFQMYEAFETCNVSISETDVGLEKYVTLKPQEKRIRKLGLMAQIMRLQDRHDLNRDTRAETLRSLCQAHSQGSVYFACFIAQKSVTADPSDKKSIHP